MEYCLVINILFFLVVTAIIVIGIILDNPKYKHAKCVRCGKEWDFEDDLDAHNRPKLMQGRQYCEDCYAHQLEFILSWLPPDPYEIGDR